MSSLAVPSLLTVAGLSLPYLGLFHFLSLPRTLPFALPEPLLSLASLVIVSCVVFSFGKPLLVSLTVPRTRPQEADGVDWIASNVIGATFVGMWVWVLKQKWPCPEGKVAFDHETRVTEVIGYTASALVIAIAVLNYLRDEATPSAGTPPQVGPTSGSKVVVSGEDAEVLLNED